MASFQLTTSPPSLKPTRKQPNAQPGVVYSPVPTASESSTFVSTMSASTGRIGGASAPSVANRRLAPNAPLASRSSPSASSGTCSTPSLSGSRGAHSSASGPFRYPEYADYTANPEDDDYLHNPDVETKSVFCCNLSTRGVLNAGTLAILTLGLISLFAGYPIFTYLERTVLSRKGAYNLGGINASGQVPDLPLGRALIDPDTPEEAKTRMSLDGKKKMNLVFSDEFNKDGRSFYPGDDPYWTAVDLHYWQTGNYEWYDPAAVTTANGSLIFTLSEAETHNLNFRGGMIQSWNQFCFTGGYIEVSLVLPGAPDVSGLWPAAWTMGNLGRAGYGAATDGLWPYTYDSCDVGTLPNQTYPTGGPIAAETTGVWVKENGPGVSYLPGQRLSRCTCDGEDHPGPRHADGSYVGRSAPEIDIIEATASRVRGQPGHVSMSAQIAPFDQAYNMSTDPGATVVYRTKHDAELNSYRGGVYQQAASGIATTSTTNYQETQQVFDTYGFEYRPGGGSDSYITWTASGEPIWRLNPIAVGPNPTMEIGQRLIPVEPMYIILNLGMSSGFTAVQFDSLKFPATMLVDYVRVWQNEGEENVGCDPPDFPTADYIERHAEAYWNANLTTWTESRERGGYDTPFPANSMLTSCSSSSSSSSR